MVTKQQVQALTVGARIMVKLDGELTEAQYAGWSNRYDMPNVNVEGRVMPRKVYEIVGANSLTPASAPNLDDVRREVAAEVIGNEPEEIEVPINVRFEYLEQLVTMVAISVPTSLVIVGSGGLGKSYTVFKQLQRHGMEEDADYVVCKGMATPKALYRVLYENRDKIVVFDDCDSVLKNETAVNLLKAGLDSTAVRTISWRTERGGDDDSSLPARFQFEGKIIFISNLELHQVNQAILSRALHVDVTMTADEKIERMRAIADHVRPEISVEVKNEVIDLLNQHKARIKDLNVRTLTKVLDIRVAMPTNWKPIATYVVTT
jgi:hypothetical protein